jgi:cell division protein FtsW
MSQTARFEALPADEPTSSFRMPTASWDWPLAIAIAALAAFGLVVMLSSSTAFADELFGNSLHYVIRQSLGLGIGGILAAVALIMPWSWLRLSAWPAFAVSLVGLLLVLSPLGTSAKGAARWIDLGVMNFQPAEFAKLALIMVLAQYLSCNEGRLRDVVGVVVPPLTLFLLPMILLMAYQRDFGTTVILVGLTGVMFFLAGLQLRYGLFMAAFASLLFTVMVIMEPYRIERLTSFVDPFADPDGSGYQVVQGWIAMASGGAGGQGLGTGVAQRGFLPEAHTDFISAVIGEELGAVGWLALVLGYLFIVYRGMRIAHRAPDLFGMLLAAGITTLMAAQAIINLGVVCGMLPAKGLVLPFLSYGASAALVHTLAIGVLLRVSREARPE